MTLPVTPQNSKCVTKCRETGKYWRGWTWRYTKAFSGSQYSDYNQNIVWVSLWYSYENGSPLNTCKISKCVSKVSQEEPWQRQTNKRCRGAFCDFEIRWIFTKHHWRVERPSTPWMPKEKHKSKSQIKVTSGRLFDNRRLSVSCSKSTTWRLYKWFIILNNSLVLLSISTIKFDLGYIACGNLFNRCSAQLQTFLFKNETDVKLMLIDYWTWNNCAKINVFFQHIAPFNLDNYQVSGSKPYL